MALSTAAASARTRESMSVGAVPAGVITCQPTSRAQFCHCSVSLASSRAMAGAGLVCAARVQPTSRLIVAQPRANSLDQFLDVISLLERRHGKHVAVVLLQVDFQLFGQFRQIRGVLEILLIFRLENFVLLRFAVGQNDVFLFAPAPPAASAAALLL